MEHYSTHNPELNTDDPEKPATIEKLTNWVVGLQAETQRQKAEQKDVEKKAELEFELRQEIRDDAQVSQQGSMIAVGAVLADKVADDRLIGATGIRRVAKQKKLAKEETQISTTPRPVQGSGLTFRQAVQLGILCGVGLAVVLLVWLSVK
jgi:hypothetical protein